MLLESGRRTIAPVLLSALCVLTSGPPASADPDFSSVGDILQGRRTLLPVDDLAVTFQIDNQATTTSLLLTSGGMIAQQVPYASAPYEGEPSVTAVVRMFNLPRDVVVTLFAGVAAVRDQVGGITQSFLNGVNGMLWPNTYALADVTDTGLRAIAFISNVPIPEQPNPPIPVLGIVMAADVNDLGQGLFYGTPLPLPASTGPFGIAAADFDGDGIDEIAVAQGASGALVVSVFKAQVTQNAQGNVTAASFVQVGSVSVASGSPVSMALTAGSYDGTTNRQLMLVYSDGPTIAQPIAVAPTSNPMQLALTLATPLPLAAEAAAQIAAQSGHLDFYENAEQVVLLMQGIPAGLLAVLTLDSQLNVTLASVAIVPGGMSELQLGLALGNFDQSGTTSPLALQIAVPVRAIFAGCDSGLAVQIFQVAPSNGFALSASSPTPLAQSCSSQAAPWVGLAAGDIQGRSLRLGAPSKITAEHMQPELILGAPPMHVDYVTPANSTQPVVLNLSAVPLGFRSSYRTSISNQSQSSRQATTSYTNAVKASVSAGVKLDVPFVESVTAKVGVSAGFMHEKSIQKRYGQYVSTSFDASTSTGFDDQLWFTQQTHYIYVYPVIGQSVCPADNSGCTPSERVPLLVMFSGPTVNLQESIGGANLEWYQPIQQVGSVFSYPWSLAQLQAQDANINLLTSANPDGIVTDSSFAVEQAKWSGQQTTQSTSGSASNISWGTSASVTEKAGIFGGITGSQKFSYNGSKAISTLYTLTTQVGESTGIGIAKPGTFPTPALYQYAIFPYIFGDDPVPGAVQKLNVGTQIQTSGILRAAFTADPTDPSAGAWWQGAYTLPDVALNHPSRWSVQIFTPPTTNSPNCVPTSQTSRNWNCVTFNPPEVDIWTSEFHYMKGLLITPDGVDGEGPQLTRATAGDALLLRARVYNYSLADMPADSTVVVRFYGQPWHPNSLGSAGNAFLIDEVELEPLQGFNSASSGGTMPNWATASARLDTSPYGDQYLAFWVLVYMQNAQGQLVAEMQDHGLVGLPPALDSIAAATPYLERHSNNIGFYKSLFYVAPPVSTASVDPREARVALTSVTASAPRVLLGDKVVVSGLVTAESRVDGLVVLVRDGTATDKGKLIDVEQVSHVRAGGSHLVRTVHRPASCGTHVLSLQVLNTPAEGQTSVHVTIDIVRAIEELIALMSTFAYRDMYLDSLVRARAAFENQSPALGVAALEDFRATVLAVLQPMVFSAPLVNLLLGKVDRVLSCAG